jgi:RHH-type transcriptional regulator, proline utilization regulon repressor / proline dehydrogenase / delta 1-pyrroline-5-carboxylate dehydrogenase
MKPNHIEFAKISLKTTALRTALRAATRQAEPLCVAALLPLARLDPAQSEATQALARQLVQGLRHGEKQGQKQGQKATGKAGLVQGLLQEFALSSQEGVALMCLAEALLRIPDNETRDALIRDKISHGQWEAHLGQSPFLFVNAAIWGLLLTGKLVATHSTLSLGATLRKIIGRGGEPLIRRGVDMAMRMMGEQFVTGETIAKALGNARAREAQGFRYSYDMLGEAAVTDEDAQKYFKAYQNAIQSIGIASAGRGIYEGPGISIKLSALHSRYSRAQRSRVMDELYPRLLSLAEQACRLQIGLNIDAEEADRLDMSLDLLERLCFEPGLKAWNGIGFVIQAYQKRCPLLIDWLLDLAHRSQHRLMIRLVKGAYWDSEIKRAQVDGLEDYPVYTRKAYTDIAYVVCAKKLLASPEAFYPQFATHNAQTLASIHTLAGRDFYAGQYEFQCLHGMGEALYEQVVGTIAEGKLARPCRIYAPVGPHETLLAYLVRRLLENGANTSFVNRIANEQIPLAELTEDPLKHIEDMAAREGTLGAPHPRITLPLKLYPDRENSQGLDLSDDTILLSIEEAIQASRAKQYRARPLLGDRDHKSDVIAPHLQDKALDKMARQATQAILNPADLHDTVGCVQDASSEEVAAALICANDYAPVWAQVAPVERARTLRRAAQMLQEQRLALMALLIREAGKTRSNAISEIREAIDFLRYYAAQAEQNFDNANYLPLGAVVCISPWNFPLAIFTGQIAAVLATGNVALAKPAEQTPLIAFEMVRILHDCGVPLGALQLLPGPGETVGAALVSDFRVQGVVFTGSTEVAKILQRTLSSRLLANGQAIPLIAETGGQNCMLVDSSALIEQVSQDVLSSAFDSAGQRCSALRVLCVQEDIADQLIGMIKGAIQEWTLGCPEELSTDIGPLIDAPAKQNIEAHLSEMQAKGAKVWASSFAPSNNGHFLPPHIIEIDSLSVLKREVFGPVLHILRYARKSLDELLAQINGLGYGLTFGVHTRIDETITKVCATVEAGNVYVNRNIVGAVVGVQPFGGEGLSGTGPKAGGPLYLLRLLRQRPDRALDLLSEGAELTKAIANSALTELREFAKSRAFDAVVNYCDEAKPLSGFSEELPGPTGEANRYCLLPRQAIACIVENQLGLSSESVEETWLCQLACVLAAGSQAVWPSMQQALRASLPVSLAQKITLARDPLADETSIDAVLFSGGAEEQVKTLTRLANRPGPIIGLSKVSLMSREMPLERLIVERSISVNTAAAGGNAGLMTIG